jgi:hypothetical protein
LHPFFLGRPTSIFFSHICIHGSVYEAQTQNQKVGASATVTNKIRFVLIYETLRQSTPPGICPCFALRLMSFFAIYLGKIRVHEGNKCSSERGLAFGGRAELMTKMAFCSSLGVKLAEEDSPEPAKETPKPPCALPSIFITGLGF